MAAINETVQTFIVQALACYYRPTQVIEAVKTEFHVEVSRQQINFYNPERGLPDRSLSERWRNLFAVTRKKFDTDVASIPIAKMSYRLSRLQRMSERAEDAGNMVLAAGLLEQAAKDRGGMFTNTRTLRVDNPARELARLLGVQPDELPDQISEGVQNEEVSVH